MNADASAPTNRLADETSPYLLQHAHDPVDWYPWGPEALARARELDRPIFLSVGYSACHWCHVMAAESFSDPRIAALLAEHFVSVKVDREERPDLDEIYMKATIALSGAGGWPMSLFLTPELEPFEGGTYYPPYASMGRPGFADLLVRVARGWAERRESLRRSAARVAEQIAREGRVDGRGSLPPEILALSRERLGELFDPLWGGLGGAPKFPHAIDLRLLLRHGLRDDADATKMAAQSLERMATGGLFDQLAGGFARYSTDEEWVVPHFEKMLYDNALLVPAYLEGWLATGDAQHARVARETADWMLAEMRLPEGGFASSQDADSEGEEGRFYVWTPGELEQALGRRRGRLAARWFDVTPEGNFEAGASVLTRRQDPGEVAAASGLDDRALRLELSTARQELCATRAQRVRPATDDKVLAAWNGLAIGALAQAGAVLDEPRYIDAARGAAEFVLGTLRRPDGRLAATWRAGRAQHAGGLDDHVFVIAGLIDLYEAEFDERWISAALELEALVARHFEDPEQGGWFTTADDHERLIARLKSLHDGALPAGSGVHALSLLRLAELTGEVELARRAERTISSLAGLVGRYPQAFGALLLAVDFLAAPPVEVVLAGPDGQPELEAMLSTVRGVFRPQRVVARCTGGASRLGLVQGRTAPAGEVRAHVCRGWSCRLPVATAAQLADELAGS